MSERRGIYLAARREVRERLRSRAFVASTVIQVAIVVLLVVIAALTSDDSGQEFDVGYIGPKAEAVVKLAAADAESADSELTPRAFETEAAVSAAIEEDEIDAAVSEQSLITSSSPEDTLVALLQSAAADSAGSEALRGEGLSQGEIQSALHPPALEVTEVGEPASGAGLAFVGGLLLYIALLSFGFVIATSVVEEKSTRVIEVVLSAIRPVQLLAGKVIGVGLLGIGQIVLIAGIGVGVAFGAGSIEMPDSTVETAVLVVVYFLLGYALYASAFAVSGAIVSRQEDVQSSSAPLTIILVVGYVVGISASDDPHGTLAQVATFVPPVAPMVVPGRAAQDALPGWELALSLLLMVLAALAMILFAAKVYERAVLRTGAPLKLRQAAGLLKRPG